MGCAEHMTQHVKVGDLSLLFKCADLPACTRVYGSANMHTCVYIYLNASSWCPAVNPKDPAVLGGVPFLCVNSCRSH